MLRIFADAAARPGVFHSTDSVPRSLGPDADLLRRVPGLSEFFGATGGGTVFESEELFLPTLADSELSYALLQAILSAVPVRLRPFHHGAWTSFVDPVAGEIVVYDNSLSLVGTAASFDEWYSRWLRAEFAERYGLEEDSSSAS